MSLSNANEDWMDKNTDWAEEDPNACVVMMETDRGKIKVNAAGRFKIIEDKEKNGERE